MAEKDFNQAKKIIKKRGAVTKKAKVATGADRKETIKLVKAGHTATANAIRASRALGLAITYMKDGILYKEYPDGRKEKIKSSEIKKSVSKRNNRSLKKGMVLHAKK